jgi:Tol biopolymer transport system component
VHRHAHKKKSAIYAYRAEVDAWWRNGHERLEQLEASRLLAQRGSQPPADVSGWRRRRRIAILATICALPLGFAAAVWTSQQKVALQADHYTKMTNDGRDKSGNVSLGIPSPIVTDRTRLYFVEPKGDAGLWGLAQVSTSGGDTIPIQTPIGNVRLADISPDRTRLLLGSLEGPTETELPFYSVPAVGGSAQRLGDFLAHDASWSPNGLNLAYANGDGFYVARSDGTAARKVVSGLGAVWWPRWSPDSKRLRFTITDTRTQDNRIWEIFGDGTHLRNLSAEWGLSGDQCCGSWLSSGKYFAFQRLELGVTTIWTVRGDKPLWGKERPAQLTSGPTSASAVTASPDGKQLYIVGGQPRTEAIRYEKESKRFHGFLPGASVDSLEFSRDGEWIAYSQFPEGTLWRARADGSERVQLTAGPMFATRPRWSPDGSRIVFFAQYPHRPWKIYMLAANGGTPTQLLSGDDNEGDATWSADGKKIAFGRLPWMPGAPKKAMLYVLDLASKEISILPGSEGLFSPRWSPSGRYLVALNADSNALMLYDFETSIWGQLAQGTYGNPDWSHDSEDVYVIDVQGNRVVRIRISDKRIEPVVNLNGERIAFTGMGPWTGLGPQDSVLATRDLSTQELYRVELKNR